MLDHESLRRRLLTALALSPLLLSLPGWAQNSGKIDVSRVVTLEWLPTELLLALGVTPYGVADTHNYRLWVEDPKLPASVIDVGQRTEPNLELLQQMAPSLILMSQGFGPSPEKLAPIAPSMSLPLMKRAVHAGGWSELITYARPTARAENGCGAAYC